VSAPNPSPPACLSYEWWAGEGDAPEVYLVSAASRDEVIQRARREYGPTATFTIVEASQEGDFESDIFNETLLETIADRFQEVNSDRWGEDGWEGFACSAEAEGELAALLGAALGEWLKKHGPGIPTWTFTDQRSKEVIGPAAGSKFLTESILVELLATPLSTAQVIGRLGLIDSPDLAIRVEAELRQCGFEDHVHRALFQHHRTVWFPVGLSEAERHDRFLAAAGWAK